MPIKGMIRDEKEFIAWMEQQLDEEISDEIVAFNINIYESPFRIEIVGSKAFTPDDDDWACNEDWVPKNRAVLVSQRVFGASWKEALENILRFSQHYFASGTSNSDRLKAAKAFAVGFVDGDLYYV